MGRIRFGHCIRCDEPIRPPYRQFEVRQVTQTNGDELISSWDDIDVCRECAGKMTVLEMHSLASGITDAQNTSGALND
jgi:hypothetical protein